MIGYVTFQLGSHEMACRLEEVREVVRLGGLDVLPGLEPPVTGVVELRGSPLPIVDLRVGTASTDSGDVLVLSTGVDAIGVVVDRVTGVHHDDELGSVGEPCPRGLPSYVVEVLRRPGVVAAAPVLLVELRGLLASAPA